MKVLITFHPTAGVSAQAVETLVSAAGGTVIQQYTFAPIVLADIPKNMVASLNMSTLIKAVEPSIEGEVGIMEVKQTSESIPTMIASLRVPWGVEKIRAPELHAKGITGKTIKVGIIDTGGDFNHPDLAPTYAGGWDFVNNDPTPMDDNSHGTHVWGTIAASVTGGILGIAPSVRVFHYKVLNAAGSGTFATIIQAYDRALADGCQVTNNSYGGSTGSVALETAIQAMANAGVLMVCSAGNTGPGLETVVYPASYPGAIAVGATDSLDAVASFSSRGQKVEISAPGVSIESTVLNGLYGVKSGTSMAAPHVVGVVALALSAGIPSADIRARMQLAVDVDAPGRDPNTGFGRIDSVAFVVNATPAPPPELPVTLRPIVTFDGSKSFDPDGTIIGWEWDFGDGTFGSGQTVEHRYAVENIGARTVTLTVLDNTGGKATKVRQFSIAKNKRAISAVRTGCNPKTKVVPNEVKFEMLGTDPDGTIVDYTWTFHDRTTAKGQTVFKTYTEPGSWPCELDFTDDYGDTVNARFTTPLLVTSVPLPTAIAIVTPTSGIAPLVITGDGSQSSSPNGAINFWEWTFDGFAKGVGPNQIFTFDKPGSYVVTMKVTDVIGADSTASVPVTVSAIPGQPPKAVATIHPISGVLPLTITCDASASTAPSGSIISYSWDMGGQATLTGQIVSYVFTVIGLFDVALTITDNSGQTSVAHTTVTVIAVPPPSNKLPTADFTANGA